MEDNDSAAKLEGEEFENQGPDFVDPGEQMSRT